MTSPHVSGSSLVPDVAFEPHFRISDLAKQWSVSRELVRLLVKEEPDVIKVRLGKKRSHTLYSIPASAARRIHTRLLNGG
jgi:hypothetical protein